MKYCISFFDIFKSFVIKVLNNDLLEFSGYLFLFFVYVTIFELEKKRTALKRNKLMHSCIFKWNKGHKKAIHTVMCWLYLILNRVIFK